MASVGAFFGKFFGNTISEAAAYGIGGALEKPLEPALQELTNETWRAGVAAGATVPLDPADAAEIVAEDVELADWGADQAAQTGIGGAQFAALVRATLEAPGFGELLTILRRNPSDTATFEHGLRKNRYETSWDKWLTDLRDDRLSPEVVALAIVRGLIADPDILPVDPPAETGLIPPFPTFDVDALTEAAAAGIDRERLSVMVGINGRPMSVQEAASAYFRGIILLPDYQRAVSEGDTRNEWRDAILEQARQIVSAEQYVQLRLRGWTDDAGLYAGAALHGMSKADADRLLLIHGRPLSWHQVWIGLQRGGIYDGPTGDIDPAFLKALQESDIRPEWYNLAWAQRYNYPSAFVLKALTAAGDITEAEAEQVLKFEGWEPTFAHKAASAWAGGTTAAFPKKTLTAAEIRAAEHKGAITHADALSRLEALGYSAGDAAIYLTPSPTKT